MTPLAAKQIETTGKARESSPADGAGRPRRGWRLLLRVAVSAALIGFLLTRLDLSKSVELVAGTQLRWFVPLLGLLVVERVLSAYRWHILLVARAGRLAFWPILRIFYAANFLGNFLPGGSIELLRVVGAARHTSDLAMSFASVLVERLLGFLTLALVVLLGVAVAGREIHPEIHAWAWESLALLVGLLCLLMNRRFQRFFSSAPWLGGFARRLDKIFRSLNVIRGRPGALFVSFVLAIAAQFIRIGMVILTAWSLGIHIPLVYFLAYVPIIVFLQALPVGIGGVGVREAAFVYFFSTAGMTPEEAFTVAVVLYLAIVLTSLPGAWFGSEGMGIIKKQAERAEASDSDALPAANPTE